MKNKKRFIKWANISKHFIGLGFNLLITKNKGIEMDVSYTKDFFSWIKLSLDWSRRQDHAGLGIEASLLWMSLVFKIYDRRPWDYDSNCWKEEPKYEQSQIKYEWF
jgi:hypothetical protein